MMYKTDNYESARQTINGSEKFESLYNQCDSDGDYFNLKNLIMMVSMMKSLLFLVK